MLGPADAGFVGRIAGRQVAMEDGLAQRHVHRHGGIALAAMPRVGWAVGVRLPLVLATMHMSWGAGFLFGRG